MSARLAALEGVAREWLQPRLVHATPAGAARHRRETEAAEGLLALIAVARAAQAADLDDAIGAIHCAHQDRCVPRDNCACMAETDLIERLITALAALEQS